MPEGDLPFPGAGSDDPRRFFEDVPIGMIACRLWPAGDETRHANAHLRLMLGLLLLGVTGLLDILLFGRSKVLAAP